MSLKRRSYPVYQIILFLFIHSMGNTKPVHLRFDHLTIDNGLSHSKVNVIFKDSRGYLWFGTNDGLNRYNGYEFTVYQHDNENSGSLSYNLIRDIQEDHLNRIWIGTDAGGLNIYNPEKDSFIHYQYHPDDSCGLTCNNINQVVKSDQGLWIATRNGLNFYDFDTQCFQHYFHDSTNVSSIAGNEIQALHIDSQNQLWIGILGAGVDCMNMQTGKIKHIRAFSKFKPDGLSVYSITEDKQGRLWVGTNMRGLYIYNPENGHLRHLRGPTGELIYTVRAFFEDTDGNMWIGSRQGLYIIDKNLEDMTLHKPGTEGQYSLNHQSVQCIFQDEIGDVWIGTRGGVNHYSPYKAAFHHYSFLSNDSRFLNSPVVYAIYRHNEGDLWFGTETGGINLLGHQTGQYTYFMYDPENPYSIHSNNIKVILKDKHGILWFGTFNGGLNYYNPAEGGFRYYCHNPSDPGSISNNDIYSIVEDRNGDLWCATHIGVSVLRRSDDRFDQYHFNEGDSTSLSHFDCKVIYEDRTGVIWIGTFCGLNRFDPESESFVQYVHNPRDSTSLSNSFIQSIFEDNRGRFWIGTLGGGLNLMDRDSGTFVAYNENDGLANNTIYGILEDLKGNLWLSTNQGLSRFDPATERFKNYDSDDGLQCNQFNYNAYFADPSGELFFGGIRGVTSFFPDEVKSNTFIPPVVFSNFFINNRPVWPDKNGSVLQKPISETNEITLAYDQSVLTFEFAALNFLSSEDNQYAYFLEGFDHDWHDIEKKRSVTFTNLDPGTYTLKIRGSNNHGIWNMKGASLRIIVTPPFIQTLWFRLLVIMTILLAGAVVFRIRTHHFTRQNKQLQAVNDQLQIQVNERRCAEKKAQNQLAKLKRAQKEIRALNEDLERKVEERTADLLTANRELEAFAYSVSHDLRAPLRSMNGFSQALLDDYINKLDDTGKDYLKRIQHASQQMGRLIDGLLKLSRLIRSEMNLKDVNISKMSKSIFNEYKNVAPDRSVAFKVMPGMIIFGDATLLRVMLNNLIDNAWKFTSTTAKAKIEFGCKKQGNKTIYYIRDNGIGFDMQYTDRLFDVFQRQHLDFQGTGIGLATVKRIVQRHGGEIWAEAQIEKGATFFFTFPSKKNDSRTNSS
ncbi:GHKL domain-containing protein [bacterium]|nr:GHKL domain-containing protein [bacterium]